MSLRLSERLLAFQALAAIGIGVLSFSAVYEVNGISAALTQINDVNSVKQRHAINFRGSVHDRAIAIRDAVLVETPADVEAVAADIVRLETFYDASAGPLADMVRADPEATVRRMHEEIRAIEERTRPLTDRILAAVRAGDRETAHTLLMKDARPLFVESLAAINRFIDLHEAMNREQGGAARESADGFQTNSLLIALATLAAMLAAGFVIARGITGPLGRMIAAMEALAHNQPDVVIPKADPRTELAPMADALAVFRENARNLHEAERARAAAEAESLEERRVLADEIGAVVNAAVAGDFTRRVAARFRDPETRALGDSVNRLMETTQSGLEALSKALAALAAADLTHRMPAGLQGAFARLRDDADATRRSLADLVGEIRAAAETAAGRSGDISKTADQLSGAAEAQAASTEEAAAAMEQISASLVSGAEGLRQAETLATNAASRSDEGLKAAAEARRAVERIAESSSKITDIISLIDSIAFQTNLLALNASVEAARAGEAGKGFAVVASEVRLLAQRSAEAAKEISALIKESAERVQEGVSGVRSTTQALDRIGEAMTPLIRTIEDVAAAGREQSSGAAEVSGEVVAIGRNASENARMADTFTAAARELLDDVSRLRHAAGAFRLADDRGSVNRAA